LHGTQYSNCTNKQKHTNSTGAHGEIILKINLIYEKYIGLWSDVGALAYHPVHL